MPEIWSLLSLPLPERRGTQALSRVDTEVNGPGSYRQHAPQGCPESPSCKLKSLPSLSRSSRATLNMLTSWYTSTDIFSIGELKDDEDDDDDDGVLLLRIGSSLSNSLCIW